MESELARRQGKADVLETEFRARPGEWIRIGELTRLVGSAFGSRIRCDLKPKRHMHIVWNGENGEDSAYRFIPHEPLGRAADVPDPEPKSRDLFSLRP